MTEDELTLESRKFCDRYYDNFYDQNGFNFHDLVKCYQAGARAMLKSIIDKGFPGESIAKFEVFND